MFKRRKKKNANPAAARPAWIGIPLEGEYVDHVKVSDSYEWKWETRDPMRPPTVEHQIFRAGPVRVPEVGERFTVSREFVTWNDDGSVTREIVEWRLVD